MTVCPNCGEENPPRFRLCGFCGTQLVAAPPPHETRKIVSILFCDLKGSTSLGESLDPESLREVMARYFDVMSAAISSHGGTIEKYIGDAVMAVFGLPRVHEDDALRAVRAAQAMQNALADLNLELQQTYGVTLANRIGVNTGEVVAGDAATQQRLVTGDAVNVAARLEQAAGEMESLIGDLTYKLVRHSVEVEPVEPLTLKGKAEPVPAYRLLGLRGSAGAEPTSEPLALVGRGLEVEELAVEFRLVKASGTPRVVLVTGEAGVGKTRLVQEFTSAVPEGTTVLRGRCLSYGDGITFWPVIEAVRAAAGIVEEDDAASALAKIEAVVGRADEEVATRLASVMGLTELQFPLQEVFWAMRRLLQILSAAGPVVLVLDDLHWAESTLHDLVEFIGAADTEAALLVVCVGRADLLEQRPELAERRTIGLERLSPEETAALIERLLGGSLEQGACRRLVAESDGNPLFAQQLVSMLREDGRLRQRDAVWRLDRLPEGWVPPTIQALLSARLDRLDREDRAVVDPASVIGYVFPLAAVSSLAEDFVREQVPDRVEGLTRSHFFHSAEQEGDELRQFDHILIRESVYDSLLKRQRASLHERFVEWADRVNGDRAVEYEEILGYHLEQAHRYLSELAPTDEHARSLGAEGARRLASAGRRAFVRGDLPAASKLLDRATALLPWDDERRFELVPDLAEALIQTGEFQRAEAVLDEARAAADGLRRPDLGAGARVVRELARLFTGASKAWSDDARATAFAVIDVATKVDDNVTLARAYRLLAWADGKACRYGPAASALHLAIEHAQKAGDLRQERRASTAFALTSAYGPTPVDEAIERCAEIAERVSGDRQAEAAVLCVVAHLESMRGSFDLARELCGQARFLFQDLGLRVEAASMVLESSRVELLAGDPAEAERELRRGYRVLEELRERYLLSTLSGLLAQALWAQGRPGEAEDLANLAEELADPDDVDAQVHWRSVQAKVLASRGESEAAERLARGAVELLESTDAVILQVGAFSDLAETLSLLGRPVEAARALAEARRLAAEKGSNVLVTRIDAVATTPARGAVAVVPEIV